MPSVHTIINLWHSDPGNPLETDNKIIKCYNVKCAFVLINVLHFISNKNKSGFYSNLMRFIVNQYLQYSTANDFSLFWQMVLWK